MNKIKLQHTDRVISFEFSGLYYSGSEKVNYAYKLEGVNNDWVTTPASKRFVTYSNLPAGDYDFHVQAYIDQDQRNNESTRLTIHMRPAPWKTPLAYILYLGFGLILLYLIRSYELRRVGLKNQLREERFESQKRQEVDRIKSEFFTNISHEFRTPLTLIKGRIHDIQKVLSSSQQKNLKKHFDISNRNIDRLEDLMNQLLDLSKIEAGTIKLNAKPLDITTFLRRIESTFQVMIHQKGLSFELALPKESIIIYFDEIKMERVINNLVANAIEFTPNGGTIQCVLHNGGEGDIDGIGSFINIDIVDTGEGIPEASLEHIFNRFYQADTTATRSHEGTGIGLALVKELTELHGGSVSVKSEAGMGTTFSIKLPKGSDHLQESEIQSKVTTIDQENEKVNLEKKQSRQNQQEGFLNILIVEDNHDMADYIRDQLKSDYNVTNAYDGEEGLKCAIEILPDIIISDVMMPKMDGYTLVKEIRKNEVLSHVPIILLTAKAGKDARITGHKSLADAYIAKPFNSEELVAQVASLLESRRRLYRKFSDTWMFQQEVSALDGPDQEFMNRIKNSIESNLSESEYSVDDLARATFLSRRQLERRLRDLTGLTPGEIIRKTRLLRARQLLENNKLLTVSETANQVGFNNVKYFSRLFQREFNIAPSEASKTK